MSKSTVQKITYYLCLGDKIEKAIKLLQNLIIFYAEFTRSVISRIFLLINCISTTTTRNF